jgi:hypothetical protein
VLRQSNQTRLKNLIAKVRFRAQDVKPSAKTNKSDYIDAEAIL